MTDYQPNGVPVLFARGETIPEAWENSVIELYEKGVKYRRAGPKDRGNEQVDSTMTIEILNPVSPVFMHKFSACGWQDLLEYQMEMLGAKDSWVDPTEKSTRWEYHYHERLAGYPGKAGKVNQLERIIDKLSTEPHKRNINAITWVPERDLTSKDPPCLQRIWFTMTPGAENSNTLSMNYNFRSRNVMIAAPMNQFGLATLQKYIAEEVENRTGNKVCVGRMVDFSDSYHVSARDYPALEKFVRAARKSKERGESILQRAYTINELWQNLEESQPIVEEKIIAETAKILEEEGRIHALPEEERKIKEISCRVMAINRKIAGIL